MLESGNCSAIGVPLYLQYSLPQLLFWPRKHSWELPALVTGTVHLVPFLLSSSSPLSSSLELWSSACPVPPLVTRHPGLLTAITFPLTFAQKKTPVLSHSWSLPKVISHGVIEVIYVQVWVTGVRENQNWTVVKAVKTDYIQDCGSKGKETSV